MKSLSAPYALPDQNQHLRRIQGVYYSPEDIARAMVDWAVRNSRDTVFDPNFGGCVFLRAGLDRLMRLGATAPSRRIFGTDVDRRAWSDAAELIRCGAQSPQFRRVDFLRVEPREVGGPFSVVVGNPPYVRPRLLATNRLNTARASLSEGVKLSAAASYWAYFVLHALKFVALGGRLALILPRTFMRADYAGPVRAALLRAFRLVTVLAFEERVFPEVDEQIVLVLAEDRGGQCHTINVGEIQAGASDLRGALRRSRKLAVTDPDSNWTRGLSDPSATDLLDALAANIGRFGEVARVRIGVVTGANRYFLVTDEIQRRWRIEKRVLRLALSKTLELRGLVLNTRDLSHSAVRLFLPPPKNPPPGATRYIRHGISEGVSRAFKCTVRDPWFVPRDTDPPDAFLSSMTWEGPRLVLNAAGAISTNTLYGVWFDEKIRRPDRLALAVGLSSTIAQFSAEIEGRACGGGLLKLEPSDTLRLVIPKVHITGAERSRLDRLRRTARWEEAREIVDARIVGSALEATGLRILDSALKRARAQRWGRSSKPA